MKARRAPLLPWILLGAMTACTFGGPLAIGAVLRGGARPSWPPDRRVEWATVLGLSATVLALMAACLGLALANARTIRASRPPRPPEGKS